MKIEINREQARDYMLLIEEKLIDIQRGDEVKMAPATIRRLSSTFDDLQEYLQTEEGNAEV